MSRKKVGVSFPASDNEDHDSISVTQSSKNVVDVNVGFLKVNNKYSIQFVLPSAIQLTDNVCCSTPSVGINITKILFQATGIVVSIEYKPEQKEGVIYEKFDLVSERDVEDKITVVIRMEVLGKHQGKPSLKRGVKCIEHCFDYESDQSDWQGF